VTGTIDLTDFFFLASTALLVALTTAARAVSLARNSNSLRHLLLRLGSISVANSLVFKVTLLPVQHHAAPSTAHRHVNFESFRGRLVEFDADPTS
jgi:hypothetical protein